MSYSATQKHADGRLLNVKGETVGRWDDNVDGVRQWAFTKGQDPDVAEEKWRAESDHSYRPIVRKVEGYYEANKNRADRNHGKNWLRVLVAFGQYRERGIKPYSAAEARESCKKWRGWEEVASALEGLERANYQYAHSYDPAGSVYQQDGTDGYVAPDDERWGNERKSDAAHKADVLGTEEPQVSGGIKESMTVAEAAYKAEQDAFAAEVEEYVKFMATGPGLSFDDWRHQKDNPDSPFSDNGVYVLDRRTGCYIAFDKVYRKRHELTSDNVRYRFSVHPNGTRQISWLALNYEGCLCFLPHNTETKTRMVPAEEVRDLIVDGWRVLEHKEYCKNQRVTGAKDDKFESFRLWVQYSPQDKPLGICPTQGDSSDGKWKHDEELWAEILMAHQVEEIAPVDAPVDIANAIQAGDWALVAQLAQGKAGG